MDLSWVSVRSKISFHHSKKSITIPLKDGDEQSFSEFCREIIPPCELNPFLFNGHLQTFWASTNNEGPPLVYKRKIFQAEDTKYVGSFAVDFVVHEESGEVDDSLPARTTYYSEDELKSIGSADKKPMLVALPGLSGGSQERYLRQALEPLVKDQAWDACVINSRGCAMSKVTSGVLYNARSTWDVRQLVLWLRETFPNRPLFAIGFSLGANILTNYVGEEGKKCVLKAAIACSNPWNLDVSALALQRTWIGLQVYSKAMGASMKNLAELHKDEIVKHTNVSLEDIRSITYLHEFDRIVQCPTWGYPTEGAYYRDASSIDSLFAVKIPFLALNAEDDPISTMEAIPYTAFKQNPHTVLCSTTRGGHLSWFQFGGQPWFVTAVTAFFKKIVEEVDLKSAGADAVSSNMIGAYDPMRRPFEVNTKLFSKRIERIKFLRSQSLQ